MAEQREQCIEIRGSSHKLAPTCDERLPEPSRHGLPPLRCEGCGSIARRIGSERFHDFHEQCRVEPSTRSHISRPQPFSQQFQRRRSQGRVHALEIEIARSFAKLRGPVFAIAPREDCAPPELGIPAALSRFELEPSHRIRRTGPSVTIELPPFLRRPRYPKPDRFGPRRILLVVAAHLTDRFVHLNHLAEIAQDRRARFRCFDGRNSRTDGIALGRERSLLLLERLANCHRTAPEQFARPPQRKADELQRGDLLEPLEIGGRVSAVSRRRPLRYE